MSENEDAKIRDGRGQFVAGHAPLPDAGRPLGSVGSGRFRPLLDMMRHAVETDALIAAAETEPSVEALLRRRQATAQRVRLHRERQRSGMRIARIRFNNRDIAALVERGFLPEGKCTNADFECAVLAMLDIIQAAKLTA